MFAQIDWTRRWYDAVRPAYERLDLDKLGLVGALNASARSLAVEQAIGAALPHPCVTGLPCRAGSRRPEQNDLMRGLVNQRGQPIRFVAQSELPEGRAYEEFIGATGCVPTRENLHDFFNGLVWLTFPLIKQQLNALQAAQIALAGVGKSRGPARDGATIFDENSALLVVREGAQGAALVAALRGHLWSEALHERGAAFGPDAQVWLFGHALMEKLVAPRKAITAHTRVVLAPDAFFALGHDAQRAWIDRHVAAALAADGLSTACFTPLPVLGVPGWWEGQDAQFYADTGVFRPNRVAAAPRSGEPSSLPARE